MKFDRLAKYSWSVLGYNLVVILWGAYVRASGSGAGCGRHWPLCNGEVIPLTPQIETLIEFTHRLMSGLALVLVLGLFLWAQRNYPKDHSVRLGANLSLLFIFTEALVGAGLVLFQWVAGDASVGRAVAMAVHLVNSFMLLACLALVAWWASGGKQLWFGGRGISLVGFGIGLLGVVAIGTSGAITALGDTLFPAGSLTQGIQQDFAPGVHFLIRLRVWHPLLAVMVGFYIIFLAGVTGFSYPDSITRRFAKLLIGLFLVQLAAGMTNLLLLAPIWLQIVHLLLADLVWIVLVLFSAAIFVFKESGERSAGEQHIALGTGSARVG